jgi:hypothetical protein
MAFVNPNNADVKPEFAAELEQLTGNKTLLIYRPVLHKLNVTATTHPALIM